MSYICPNLSGLVNVNCNNVYTQVLFINDVDIITYIDSLSFSGNTGNTGNTGSGNDAQIYALEAQTDASNALISANNSQYYSLISEQWASDALTDASNSLIFSDNSHTSANAAKTSAQTAAYNWASNYLAPKIANETILKLNESYGGISPTPTTGGWQNWIIRKAMEKIVPAAAQSIKK